MTYSVYKLTSPEGKVYIGLTKNKPNRRWQGGTNYKSNQELLDDILAFGWDNFRHEILGTTESEDLARELEAYYIYTNDIVNETYNKYKGTAKLQGLLAGTPKYYSKITNTYYHTLQQIADDLDMSVSNVSKRFSHNKLEGVRKLEDCERLLWRLENYGDNIAE